MALFCLLVLNGCQNNTANSETTTIVETTFKQTDETNNEIFSEKVEQATEKIETIKNDYSNSSKILVAYFSAQTHTKRVAEHIVERLNADIFEMEPVDAYSEADLNYNDSNSRVCKEHNNESLQDVKLKNINVPNFEDYDTIFLGYPIWWGNAAWPINDFVKNNDFTGKKVIPFCTSQSSGIGNSDKSLKEMTNTGDWVEGKRFQQNVNLDEVSEWVDSVVK